MSENNILGRKYIIEGFEGEPHTIQIPRSSPPAMRTARSTYENIQEGGEGDSIVNGDGGTITNNNGSGGGTFNNNNNDGGGTITNNNGGGGGTFNNNNNNGSGQISASSDGNGNGDGNVGGGDGNRGGDGFISSVAGTGGQNNCIPSLKNPVFIALLVVIALLGILLVGTLALWVRERRRLRKRDLWVSEEDEEDKEGGTVKKPRDSLARRMENLETARQPSCTLFKCGLF
ncbi:hypothetical protein C8R46DRAFT_1062305 [Mycena filopes]|nr:hypothetical protein C8R46DRAFT_1062305 [Mycena filopes]